jgi:L-ascorbate metabolism protein UlaG (beta-lactamase superfamily)
MKLRIANACFLITLAGGRRMLTDPWFCGPCQQTWWNFPPVHDRLTAEVRASGPDFLYISHLHHDHLHAESLVGFARATPVIVGQMNTPNLKNALAALGFRTLIETPFETRAALANTGAELVLFKDFHGNTLGDDTQVDYDLDTSLYLFDADGARLFLAVDNTILPRRHPHRRVGAPASPSFPTPRPRCSRCRWRLRRRPKLAPTAARPHGGQLRD